MDDSTSKRRRGLGVVTANACTECRKKRAKCDGQRPCGRCASQKHIDCVYEVPVRQSKENMRNEIEQLREQQRQSERILAAVVSKDRSDEVLEALRTGERIEAVVERLDIEDEGNGKGKARRTRKEEQSGVVSEEHATTFPRRSNKQVTGGALKGARSTESSPPSTRAFSETYPDFISQQPPEPSAWSIWGSGNEAGPSTRRAGSSMQDDIMQWSPHPPSADYQEFEAPLVGEWDHHTEGTPDATTEFMRGQGRHTILGDGFGIYERPHEDIERWTTVTSDNALVEHLMALYFCWEYPTFASLSKEHFLDDFRLGRQKHCSSLLVNAILAVGCKFSTQGVARHDPENSDSNITGDRFFAEAVKILEQEEDRQRLTTIQALGLMSIREASSGRSSEAIYYSGQSIRLAIEMGLHRDGESGVIKNSLFDQTVRSATFWGAFALDQCWSLSIGRLPSFSRETKLISTPPIVEHIEASPWIPYTDDGDGLSGALWQMEMTGDAGAPIERNFTQPSNVRSLYTCYTPGNNVTGKGLLDIYTRYLSWYDSIPEALRLGQNFTPAVLFCHMYYHYAILLLFRPFIKLDIVGSGVSPRDVCAQAADAISALVNSYSQLYTLRRTPSLVPYFILASSISQLVAHGTNLQGTEQLHQGIADLKIMDSCHGFASRARDILQFLAAYWEIEIIWNDDDGNEVNKKLLCRPRRSSLNQFCPNVESDDIKSYFMVKKFGDNSDVESEALLRDSLFSPFPLQGRPLLGAIKAAGFKILSPNPH